MKKLLFLLPLLLTSCTINQRINYPIDNIKPSETLATIPINVDIKLLSDNRANIEENKILFTSPREVTVKGQTYCINSERHYNKATVVSQITQLLVEHFNQAKLFTNTYYGENINNGYVLTGTLTNFYGEQNFSVGAAVGAQFGLIGALATSNLKTSGKIVIEISDLKLFKKDSTLIKDFGNFYKEYEGDFRADAYCWCIYGNVNEKLKEFNTQLIEKIRSELLGVDLQIAR